MALNGGAIPYRTPLEQRDGAMSIEMLLAYGRAQFAADVCRVKQVAQDRFSSQRSSCCFLATARSSLCHRHKMLVGALMPNFKGPPLVLVVDDDPDQVDGLVGLLSQHGMVSLRAYNGQQCLDIVRQNPIDVIVLDLEMPGMSGLEVCAALEKEIVSHSLAIIILTARDEMEIRIEGLRFGITEFITKPSNSQVLIPRIQAQVERCRKIRELG
jgi:PleD family two-component response regulator